MVVHFGDFPAALTRTTREILWASSIIIIIKHDNILSVINNTIVVHQSI
jgi:hypothetical protein